VKYKVDQWVIYRPFPNDKSSILNEMQNRAVILYIHPKNEFYDYDIYIEDTGKKKKVREHQLFPEPDPTY